MISVNYYIDPKPIIQNAIGVITVTGSAAYEAALLGKKAIVFGDVYFNLIEWYNKVKKFMKNYH